MKNSLQKCKFLLAFLVMTSFSQLANAQLVGNEIFLKGQYVEVGIATNGAFGTDNAAPSGYHPRSGGGLTCAGGLALGFVADPDKDGWTVGTPIYIGDYYLPGSPQEGWDILYNGIQSRAWRSDPSAGTSFTGGLTGLCTSYDTTLTYKTGLWEGTLGSTLKIKAQTKVKNDKVYFVTTVQITNTTSSTIYNVYYERTVDPDNEVETETPELVSGYTTKNKITYRLPNAGNKSLVTAVGTKYGAYLGLGSRDCRARPYIMKGGLTPSDSLNHLFDSTATNAIFKVDSLYTQDVGIGIVFKIDSIKAHDSTVLSYAYILREADLDSAFEDLKPVFRIAQQPYISNDTAYACIGSVLPIDILNGDFYDWTWSPSTGLSSTKGSHVELTVGTTPITYTATPTPNGLCPIDPISVTVVPIPNPPLPKVVTPIYYCQHDVAAPLTATPLPGDTIRWYTVASGGTGLTSITPLTNVVGSKYYYVTQYSSICESFRDSIQVITRALPKLSLVGHTDPTYCAALDGTITMKVDSSNSVFMVGYDKNGVPQTTTVTSDASGNLLIAGLSGGKYSAIYVVNKYGCKSDPFYGPVTLVDPAGSGPDLTNNGPVCEGSIAILKAGTISGSSPLSYSWTGPAGFSSSVPSPSFITSLSSAGVYTLVVTKGSCVLSPTTTTLEIKAGPQHQNFQAQSLCENGNLHVGTTVEVGATYQWTGPGFSSLNPDLNISNIQSSQSGTYTLLSTSAFGCSTLDTINIKIDKNITITYVSDTSICANDSAQLFVTTDAPSVNWTPTDGLDNPNSINPKASPAQTTIYTVTGNSNSTCPNKTGTVTVTIVQPPSVVGYDTLVRMNVPYTLMPLYGQSAVKWQWVPSDSLSCSNCPTPVFNSNKDMQYLVYATNSLGCTSYDTVNVRVFCDGASITMPNAFTPNGDGHNDIYYVRGNGFIVKKFVIYNRLGQEVFSKTNFAPNDPQYGWDGTFQGSPISDAAGFVYVLEVQCFNSNNAPFTTKGTVLMIK